MGRDHPCEWPRHSDRHVRYTLLGNAAMRSQCQAWLIAAAVFSMLSGAAVARVAADVREVLADAPTDLSVTVYRAPRRDAGEMDLDDLQGFALIRETRTICLPVRAVFVSRASQTESSP